MTHPLDAVIKTNVTNYAEQAPNWDWLAADFMDRLDYDCKVPSFDLHMNAVTKVIWELVLPSEQASFKKHGWVLADHWSNRERTVTWEPDRFTIIENDAVPAGTIYAIQPTVNEKTGELNEIEEWCLFRVYGLCTDPVEYQGPGKLYSDVAQLVEPAALDSEVEGSSPSV